MNLRRIKHTFLRLSLEEKVIGIGSIATLIGCFMPWYYRSDILAEKRFIDTAFSGDLGVIGFVIFIMTLLSLIVLIAENMHLPFPYFGFKRGHILFFFLGQSAFLSLLTISINTKRSLEFTDAGLRFGIYLVLIGSIFAAFSAFALIRKNQKDQIIENLEEEIELNEEMAEVESEAEVESGMEIETELNFIEDAEILNSIKPELGEKEDNEKKTKKAQEESEEKPKNQINQGNFFSREAGIETSKEKEEGATSKKPDESYEDM